jgi:hypothetical protein
MRRAMATILMLKSNLESGTIPRMSVTEILERLDHLSPDELKVIQDKINLLNDDTEETPEMLAAIDEGLRSLEEEPTITLEELRKEMRTWTFDSK